MADPAEVETQNILPVQALFNVDNSFNTFIGQGQPFIVSATDSIGIQDVTTLNATLYPTLSPVSTGQVTTLDVTSTKLTFNPSTGTLAATIFQGALNGTASATSNIANGVAGNILYQNAPGVTAFVTNGLSGQVLTSNGSSAPTWSNPTAYATVTDDTTTNATRYPLFADATAGNLTTEFVSSTKYQFNPSTGVLTATGFSGSGAALTNIPNGALVNSSVTIGSTSVALGATVTTFAGLTSVTSTAFVGALTGNASTATTATTATNATNVAITDDTTTVSAVYPTFVTNTTGNLPVKTSSTKLSFVPSTGTLALAAVQATNSAGLSLKNSAGTTQMSMGAGGGDNMSINVSTNLNGTNAQIDISPTGTGHVHIKPTGVNSIEIAPVSVGDMDNMIIGATTPAAGTFTTLTANSTSQFGRSSANYFELTGGAAGKAVEAKALGSDTDIAFVIDSKGAGAIDLAAGSSGVNISNGGTVTALTQTAGGSYASVPTVAITAPTTAGGVQATATVNIQATSSTTIASGGTGYTVNDVLTVVGGTGSAAQITVATVSAGVITGITISTAGNYSATASNPVSVTGGTGSGATFNMVYTMRSGTFVITNAGSGYVEQPTVSFSGGGGSGAAAYATVGSGTVIRALGASGTQALDFHTAASATNNAPVLRLRDVSVGTSNTGFVQIQNNNGYSSIIAQGPTNAALNVASNGTGVISFNTNSTIETTQMRVAHTASAVNYVQVTGAATGSGPTISAQGSNADIDLNIAAKGTGNVRFGTYTAGILTPTGYITVKDSGGTTRRLLVG